MESIVMVQGEGPRLNVVLVAPVPPPFAGGIANWTHIIQRVLNCYCDKLKMTYVDTSVRWRNQTNLSLFVRVFGGSVQAVRDIFRLWRKILKDRRAVVHIVTSGGLATPRDLVMVCVAKTMGARPIIHYRIGTLSETISRRGLQWKVLRRVLECADQVVVLDRASEAAIKEALPTCHVTILPNMVDLAAVDDARSQVHRLPSLPSASDLRIVFVGHVVPTKGVEELVRACLMLTCCSWVLEIVGVEDAVFRRRLEDCAAEVGLANRVRFYGHLDHDRVLQFIGGADLFVLPSYTEGAPNVILEAMACGRAILGTDVGAIPEMLDIGGPGECGACVQARDTEALFRAMTAILGNPAKRRELGERARMRVERAYSIDVIRKQLINLWTAVASAPIRLQFIEEP